MVPSSFVKTAKCDMIAPYDEQRESPTQVDMNDCLGMALQGVGALLVCDRMAHEPYPMFLRRAVSLNHGWDTLQDRGRLVGHLWERLLTGIQIALTNDYYWGANQPRKTSHLI